MGDAKNVLPTLSSGDTILLKFDQEDIGECKAEVILSTTKGVRVDTMDGIELFGGESEGLWIEFMPRIHEDYPVLLGQEGTDPNTIITEIEVVEDNSLLG